MDWTVIFNVLKLIEAGVQVDLMYNELKKKEAEGATAEDIKAWLDAILDNSIADAYAAVDAMDDGYEGQ